MYDKKKKGEEKNSIRLFYNFGSLGVFYLVGNADMGNADGQI